MDIVDCSLYTDKPFPTLRMSGRVLVLYQFMSELFGMNDVAPFESQSTLSNILDLAIANGYTQVIFNIEGAYHDEVAAEQLEALQWAYQTHPSMPIGVFGNPNGLSVGPGSTLAQIQAINNAYVNVFAQPNLRIAVPCVYTRHDVATAPGWNLWVADVARSLDECARCCPNASILFFTRPRYDQTGWYDDPENPKIHTFMEAELYLAEMEYLKTLGSVAVWSGPEAWGDNPQDWFYTLLDAGLLLADTSTDLEARYTFAASTVSGSTITDVSGNNHTGTSHNSPTYSAGPVPGGRWIELNGTNQYVDLAGSFSGIRSAGSVAYWVLPGAGVVDFACMIGNSNSNQSSVMFCAIKKDGTNNILFYDGNHFNRFGGVLKNPCPVHVGLAWTGGQIDLYVNGRLAMTSTGMQDPLDAGETTFIGALGGPANFFKGKIADVWVFARALSPQDFQAIAAMGQRGYEVVTTIEASASVQTWTPPPNLISDIFIEAYGTGGAGGSFTGDPGNGGGAGVYSAYMLPQASAAALTIRAFDGAAHAGGSTSVMIGVSTILLAKGGTTSDAGDDDTSQGDIVSNSAGAGGVAAGGVGGGGGGSSFPYDSPTGVVGRSASGVTAGTGFGNGGQSPNTQAGIGGGAFGASNGVPAGIAGDAQVRLTYRLSSNSSGPGTHKWRSWHPWLITG